MRIRGRLVLMGMVAGAALVTYRLLLTDDARENLKKAGTAIADGYEKVSDALGINRSYAGEGEALAHDHERLSQEWEDVGF